MRWTRKTIIEEIKKLYTADEELNYTAAEANHLNLVRAAAWHFGTWRRAVEAAGIDYESLSKYRRWDPQRIVERIRELNEEGADLSWRAVSLEVDPPLAAAALRPNGFASWRDAISAAGLDINQVARYQSWDPDRIIKDIKALHKAGKPLSSKAMQVANQPLFCAGRRKFGSWDDALAAAGLNVAKIRLRQPRSQSMPSVASGSNGLLNGAAKNSSLRLKSVSGKHVGRTAKVKTKSSRAVATPSTSRSTAAKPTSRASAPASAVKTTRRPTAVTRKQAAAAPKRAGTKSNTRKR